MSKDDFDVIVCKVLEYLYACLKAGVEPSVAKAKELAGCNDMYFAAVVDDLADRGLVKINEQRVSGPRFVAVFEFRITMDGVHFLDENDIMAKVRKLMGAALPELITAAVQATSLI